MSRVPLVLGTATDHNGNAVHWSELAADRPLVVVFIKDGCPCGVEFEPFFHRLASAYQDVARFVGVIDADVAAARRYADMNHVPYLLLADPGREIIGRFQAENGAYVGLLAPGGVIEAVWPGCSAAMMRELSEQLARLGGVSQRTVELAGLPNALTAGCPFALTKE